MDILNHFSEIVKSDSVEKSEINALIKQCSSEILFEMSPKKEAFEEVDCGAYSYHRIKKDYLLPIQNKCSFGIPTVLANEPKEAEKMKRKNKPKEEIYPEAFLCALDASAFRANIKLFLAEFICRWSVTCVKENENFNFFLSNSKGTPAYFKKIKWLVHDTCKYLDKTYKNCFFLTLTCNPALHSHNIITRYQEFAQEVNQFLRYMSREFGFKYVRFTESTFSCLPHVHILFYTNEDFTDIKERYNRKKRSNYICAGRIFSACQKWWGYGFFQLQKNIRGGTENYLTKYISKCAGGDLKALLKKERYTKEEIKMLLTILLPVISQTRQFSMSKGLKNLAQSECERETSEFSQKNESVVNQFVSLAAKESESRFARLRAYLIALCIKSPPSCLKSVAIASFGGFEKDFGSDFEELAQESPEQKQFIFNSMHCLTCGGCVLSQIMRNCLYNEPITPVKVDNSELLRLLLFEKWYLTFHRSNMGVGWAKNEGQQIRFLDSMANYIAKSCGGNISAETFKKILKTPHQLWLSELPSSVAVFFAGLIGEPKRDMQQKLDDFNAWELFDKTFNNFILTSSANGVIITENNNAGF